MVDGGLGHHVEHRHFAGTDEILMVTKDGRARPQQFLGEVSRLLGRVPARVAYSHNFEAVEADAAQCGVGTKVATAHSPTTDEAGAQTVHEEPLLA